MREEMAGDSLKYAFILLLLMRKTKKILTCFSQIWARSHDDCLANKFEQSWYTSVRQAIEKVGTSSLMSSLCYHLNERTLGLQEWGRDTGLLDDHKKSL